MMLCFSTYNFMCANIMYAVINSFYLYVIVNSTTEFFFPHKIIDSE